MSETKEFQANRFLEFSLGKEAYAIPLLQVREVISIPETTPIPKAPAHFVGIMNLRGQVISVMDLRRKLGIKSEEGENKEESVVILDFGEFRLGVIVDSINKVLTVSQDELKDIPLAKAKVNTDYIDSVFDRQDSLVVVINIGKALDVEDLVILESKDDSQPIAA